MKKINKISAFVFLSAVSLFSSSILKNKDDIIKTNADEEMVTQFADVSQFGLVFNAHHSTNLVIDEENQTMTTNGAWDSAFLSTNQFDTGASSYSFKTHVTSTEGNVNDGGIGFNLYFNNDNYVTFYLCWKQGMVMDTIAEGVYLCHVNGQWNQVWEYAKYPIGPYITASTFTDIWSDYGGWGKGPDRFNITSMNLRGNSHIIATTGFDMTLYVDRVIYNDRLVDVMQYQIDAFEVDGFTPATYYSPRYAIDALTNPKGAGERIYAHLKPKIGFFNNAIGNVTYSNIVFKHNNVKSTISSNFNVYGDAPKTHVINNDTKTITYENDGNFNSSFSIAEDVNTSGSRIDLSARVSGTYEDVNDSQIGFAVFHDDLNYMIAYLRWSGVGTIDGIHFLFTVDGNTESVYSGARIPWDNSFETPANFKDLWSDNSGFITDFEVPCGIDDNFNKIRGESQIKIATGFRMNLSKIRVYYLSRLVDVYQIGVTALGTDSKEHTWYSPSWTSDAFTYPKGGGESLLINNNPKIGFYGYNCGEVTLSDLEFNGNRLEPYDPLTIPFGTRTEGDWDFTGSNNGANWTYDNGELTEVWEYISTDDRYLEVTAFTDNVDHNYHFGAKLKFTQRFGNKSLIGIYPYYLDANNYLLVYLGYEDIVTKLVVCGKINGNYLGGVEYLADEINDYNYTLDTKLEISVEDDNVSIYLGNTLRETYAFTFARQTFGERELTNAKVGFVAFNASCVIKEIQKKESRIFEFTPTEQDVPIIYEIGTRPTYVSLDSTIELPTYQAFNFNGEIIDHQIEVTKPNGDKINLASGINSFVADQTTNEENKYVINVTAIDEWGNEANTITYTIDVYEYLDPLTPIVREVIWQTKLIISFFSLLLVLTTALAIVLLMKNKKEAKLAEELNRKNREKNMEKLGDDY
ncbi:MAG: hypothetical protein BWX74_00303 [Tenericutes bacterium ADurb.Bin087]|nr:MAG: hypothetical protein BWX74_00303 [Tenericutes bacterium ADurb.Bin087]